MTYKIGWDKRKVEEFKAVFYEFIKHVTISSKEKGRIALGGNIYRAQQIFLDGVWEALENDIHDIYVLKSRQLGISTVSRPLSIAWLGFHDGLRAYMVYDTASHCEEARVELIEVIKSLPSALKFPRIVRENRTMVMLSNGSMITFVSAGVKNSRSGGTLGRGSGINFAHCSEMCSWENTEGLESFRNALAEDYENRLYIWESTARGFNSWYQMWNDALADPTHKKSIFVGWWAKDNQRIDKRHPDFLRYGVPPPTEDEILKIEYVHEHYGWQVTDEQLAWYRRKMDPTAEADGDGPIEFVGDVYRIQEQPWTEEEAFQQTGATFFESDKLTQQTKQFASKRFQSYAYVHGSEFHETRIIKAVNTKSIELKVWDEPTSNAVYVLGADPAFGSSDKNDRSALQILRCYADGVDQVAEFAWPLCTSMQFAWVIASLMGWYASQGSDVYLILELNGPGDAVWRELQALKSRLAVGYKSQEIEDPGLRDVFKNVRNFIYSRADAMGPGRSWQWKTTGPLKVSIMERLRSYVGTMMVWLRSHELLQEMTTVQRDGDSIEAQGADKDDRTMALALAVHFWDERIRKLLIAQNRTRSIEESKTRLSVRDQVSLYCQNQITDMFKAKQRARAQANIIASRGKWR